MSAALAPLLIRPDQAAQLLGCARRTFYSWAERPDFPKPVVLSGSKGQRWFVTDLEAWARSRQEPAQLFIVKNAALFLGFSRARFYQVRETEGFPAPVKLPGPNADPMYRREDLEAWVRGLPARGLAAPEGHA